MSSGKMRQQSRHLPAFILLLVAEAPSHGGAIQTWLQTKLPSLKADSGAIYRALQRLEQDGELGAEWDTSKSGPPRKIYRITAAGWEKLRFWREDVEQRLQNLTFFVQGYERLQARHLAETRARNQHRGAKRGKGE
jgi:PadR family transcriptional regulator, regulatory protein PadR